MTRLMILATVAGALAVVLASPADAQCIMSYCKDRETTIAPPPATNWAITNTSRQRIGDVYNPGRGRRLQIRDTSRRIIGHIEADGMVTNTSRQPVRTLDW